jgi:hypothetical protein
MNFEDRLRNHLHDRTAEIHIEPEGVDVLADRVRGRRTRRTIAAAAAALVLIAGLTTVLVTRGDDTPDQVATEGLDDEATEGGTDDADGERGVADAAGTSPADTDDLPDVVLPEPGSALVFTNIDDETSPGGFNVWQNGHARDLYYVLSTAPGSTWEDLEASGRFAPDTLYTWDGDRWATGSFGDRFVTEIDATDRGILYAISTGSVAADGLEAGWSDDGGITWNWTPIDLSGQFGETLPFGFQALTASNGESQLVVVHRPAEADWDEAIALAEKYGVEIDQSTDEIYQIDSTGIAWVPDVYEVGACDAAFNAYFDSLYAEFEEELYEPPVPYEGDLTAEEMAELRAWEEQQRAVWDQRRLDAIDHMQTVPGCEEFSACMVESVDREIAMRDIDTSSAFIELERRAEAGENISDEEWIAAEEEAAAVWDEYNTWMEESGCGVVLYGYFSEPEPSQVERITWEELGVNPPASWSGSTHAYLVADGNVRPLGPEFASSTGWLVDVRSTREGFEVVFDDTAYEPFEAEPGQIDAHFTTWSSLDGEDWSAKTSAAAGYESGAVALDGSTLSIVWTENRSDLIRTNADGTSDRLLLADLAPDLDTSGYTLVGVDSGPYGVVVWASKWDDIEARRDAAGENPALEDGDYVYDPNSIILYSPDGRGWGATPLPGTDIADAIVGRDDVMVFLADPDFNGTDTPPQPVLLGTAD